MQKNSYHCFTLREEYLADFLKRFDMNNLLSADGGQDAVPCGILRKMFSVIDNNNDMNAEIYFFKDRIKRIYGKSTLLKTTVQFIWICMKCHNRNFELHYCTAKIKIKSASN